VHERCSPAVSRAIESVLAPGETSLLPSRLLAALLDDEDGRAAVLLREHGLIREQALAVLALNESSVTRSVDRLLVEARSLSRERSFEGTVTSEFFLLSLLREDMALRDLLVSAGLDHARFEHAILGDTTTLTVGETFILQEPADRQSAGRILDVNANRARESLRILDDYARFVLDDACLTREIKQLRHDLVALLETLPEHVYLDLRETANDVGTNVSVPGEMERSSPRDVARVNVKRLQEALRSLEEYSKTFNPILAEGLESLRYRAYTLERAILRGADARKILADVQLYVLLTGAQCTAALDWTIAEAAAGGAKLFQLREKDLDDRRLLQRAREVRRWTRDSGVLFLMNDRPDIARLAEADGVHLGQDDLPVHEARRILGSEAIIGVSTHNLEQVRQAVMEGANYIGVGPAFVSTTKQFERPAGLDFVRAALKETSLPAFVIGGVNERTIDAAVAIGANRVAVSAVIAQSDDPRLAARILCEALAEQPKPDPGA